MHADVLDYLVVRGVVLDFPGRKCWEFGICSNSWNVFGNVDICINVGSLSCDNFTWLVRLCALCTTVQNPLLETLGNAGCGFHGMIST